VKKIVGLKSLKEVNNVKDNKICFCLWQNPLVLENKNLGYCFARDYSSKSFSKFSERLVQIHSLKTRSKETFQRTAQDRFVGIQSG
jgi:hypothetical protein